MTEIVLFHHAQGLTPGIDAFADELRRAGHTVHTPDLYDGHTFDTLEEGVGYAQRVGFESISEQAVRAVEALPAAVVYSGISLGVGPAQRLAQTREGARGALLISACLPRSEFGASWPEGVPAQIHAMEHDPEFDNGWDLPAARAIVDEAGNAALFLYPGDQHLFADKSLPSYDADAAALLTERVLGFLISIEGLDEHGRPEPPLAADELTTLLGFLDYQRATLDWKSRGLDAAGLQAKVGTSSITLGGMLKHLAWVEDYWFSRRLHGWDAAPPWDTVDWKADPDWDWHLAPRDTPEQLHTLWQDAVSHSRSRVAEALAEGGLDVLARQPWPNGESTSLRWIVVHMIEEYARHNGHADLIRESVDGETGE